MSALNGHRAKHDNERQFGHQPIQPDTSADNYRTIYDNLAQLQKCLTDLDGQVKAKRRPLVDVGVFWPVARWVLFAWAMVYLTLDLFRA